MSCASPAQLLFLNRPASLLLLDIAHHGVRVTAVRSKFPGALLTRLSYSVPKFFRWLSERYPPISQLIADNRIPEFDCLYVRIPSPDPTVFPAFLTFHSLT